MVLRRVAYVLCLIALPLSSQSMTFAQSLGIELHNTLMPASGGMGGASLAMPQDPQEERRADERGDDPDGQLGRVGHDAGEQVGERQEGGPEQERQRNDGAVRRRW